MSWQTPTLPPESASGLDAMGAVSNEAPGATTHSILSSQGERHASLPGCRYCDSMPFLAHQKETSCISIYFPMIVRTADRAVVRENGAVSLECSAINFSDARVFGYGELHPTDKRNSKYPDLKGTLDKADEDGHYDVAGWWKETTTGVKYLSLSLT
jgi:hypothetical protein